MNTEQLNIEGKRSGEGFVAHRALLVSALSRALAERVELVNITLGRKGLLGYLKALGGSNIVKIVPSNGNASGERVTGSRLKVICGANTSYLDDGAWIKQPITTRKGVRGGTPLTVCQVKVSPSNWVKPNIGASELAHALTRVLPFTAKDDNRPLFQCVNFEVIEGKLAIVSADGFSLAIATLDYGDGEGHALVNRDNLKGIANALKRAQRARISLEPSGESLDGFNLILDTELIRYKWTGYQGNYPEWQKLVPTELKFSAHFDTVEAIKAVNSLKALVGAKVYPIDLTIGNGKVVMADPDNKGEADLPADTTGEAKIRVDGRYLTQALKACGGMVELGVNNAYSPMLFSTNGYRSVVMPMVTDEARKQAEADRKEKAEQGAPAEPAQPPQPPQPAKVKAHKPKKNRKRERVAVA